VTRTAGAAKATDIDPTTGKAAEVSTAARSGLEAGMPARHLPGTHAAQHPARGPIGPAAVGEPAEVATTPAGSGFGAVLDASTGTAAAGIPAAQQGPAAHPVSAGQPVTASRSSEPMHQHPAAELPPASQVAGPVLALRARGDGSHQLIVALHPAELGPINVHVRIEGDVMTIQLASTSEAAHDTLRDALPQLRSELQSAGVQSASLSLDLTSGGSGSFGDPRHAGGAPARPASGSTAAENIPVPPRHRTSGGRIGTPSSSGLDRWL
jgi:hypothetical protein